MRPKELILIDWVGPPPRIQSWQMKVKLLGISDPKNISSHPGVFPGILESGGQPN